MLLPPQTSEPVDANYAHARRQAFLDAIMNRFRRYPHELLPLAEVRARVGVHGQHDRGIQLVPLANIVGSQGRSLDFDRSFRRQSAGNRSTALAARMLSSHRSSSTN